MSLWEEVSVESDYSLCVGSLSSRYCLEALQRCFVFCFFNNVLYGFLSFDLCGKLFTDCRAAGGLRLLFVLHFESWIII